jgi:argininosuccinate lyase
MMATDLADYLVRKGVPFREAHAMAGKAVRAAEEKGVRLEAMPLEAYQALGPFEADVYQVFEPLQSVLKKNATGGTSPLSVQRQIQSIKSTLVPSMKDEEIKQKGV